MKARRAIIDRQPFLEAVDNWQLRGLWPAKWIAHPGVHADQPAVVAFCVRFSTDCSESIRIHVTADERYELFVDGERIGRGPDRGDRSNWFYDSYDLEPEPGDHVIVARTWWLGELAPYAQISVRPGFLLAAEGEWHDRLSTGAAPWECKEISGYRFTVPDLTDRTGPSLAIDASKFPWGFETGSGGGWREASIAGAAGSPVNIVEWHGDRTLKPSLLPAMVDQSRKAGSARFVSAPASPDTSLIPIAAAECLQEDINSWNCLLQGESGLTVRGDSIRRVIVDLEQYYCAYPEIVLSGGKGSSVRVLWAESLFETAAGANGRPTGHGNRDVIEGKYFRGKGDVFEADGGTHRRFETLWWQSGRYLEVLVSTSREPLTIDSFSLRETRYPLERESAFDCSDGRLVDIVPIMLRGLQMCCHETYMDCPYLEQLMYVGDTRLQILSTYATTRDDRLARKALRIVDQSRLPSGLTQSRYPSRILSIIPPFCLWWIAMVHDYAMWRPDRAFVAELLPGVRSVIDVFRGWLNTDHLLEAVPHWNFTDWTSDWWPDGDPPDAKGGISGVLNWQFVLVLGLAAELEQYAGEPEYAQIDLNLAERIRQALDAAFWDEQRGMYADDLARRRFSEHSQCLALLSGQVEDSMRDRLAYGLENDPGITRATIAFAHYVFEAYDLLGRTDLLIKRLGPWFEWRALGLRTTPEGAPTSLSDCHGWGSHPLYHYMAGILGIRPAEFGFSEVRIVPRLGPLTWARGSMPHPKGCVTVNFRIEQRRLAATVDLPDGLEGTLVLADGTHRLVPGLQHIEEAQ